MTTEYEMAPSAEAAPGAVSSAAQSRRQSSSAPAARQNKSEGSWNTDDDQRPTFDCTTDLEAEFLYRHEDGRPAYSVLKGRRADGDKAFLTGRRFAGALDMLPGERRDNPDAFYKHPAIDNYEKGKGSEPDLLYRLPELLADLAARPDDPVFVCEGEKDVETARAHGLIATTSPNGAGKFRSTFAKYFADRDVVVVPDADDRGRKHGDLVASILWGVARSVKVIDLWRS